jgi:predicted transcriptional regulator
MWSSIPQPTSLSTITSRTPATARTTTVRHWRERKAYTLDTAAKALGISRRMVAYYEQGNRAIPRVVALATRGLELG